jgi:imidazolonepropionase-like amidohydrolase
VIPAVLLSSAVAADGQKESILLHAARVFDGDQFRTNTSILLQNGQVAQIEQRELLLVDKDMRIIDLGDATILPGLIELHAHLAYRNVPAEIVLQHGITTIRDLGGPVHAPYGGRGNLRVLTSGPIITAPGGYPIPLLGETDIARAVSTAEEAREVVRDLIKEGAVVIKVALEPGGETGAPWSSHHDHHHGHGEHAHGSHDHVHDKQTNHRHSPDTSNHSSGSKQEWPLLSEEIVKAIVSEAQLNNRKVTAHVAEEQGVRIAVNAGIDEWAHMPCDAIPEALLQQAVTQKVKVVTTIDTLSKCTGIKRNAKLWSELGGKVLYGAEIAHPEIPWGVNTQELTYMMQLNKMDLTNTLRAATSQAGEHLNLIPMLGTLQPGAPADIVAVKGDLARNLKKLEYPDLVISGGQLIVNKFLNK